MIRKQIENDDGSRETFDRVVEVAVDLFILAARLWKSS